MSRFTEFFKNMTPAQSAMLMQMGGAMMSQPYSRLPQSGFEPFGAGISAGQQAFQRQRILDTEKEERAQREQALQIAMADPNIPPQQKALIELMARNGAAGAIPQLFPNQAQSKFGTGEYENFLRANADAMNLPIDDPRVQRAAAEDFKAWRAKPPQSINVGPSFERTMDQKMAELDVKTYEKFRDEGHEARKMIQTYDSIDRLLSGVGGGPLGPFVSTIQGAAKQMGIPIEAFGFNDETTQRQAAEMFSSQVALMYRNPDSGFGLPGATSNRELNFVQRMAPGTFQTEEARRLAVKIAKAQFGSKVKLQRYAEQLRNMNGGRLPSDFAARMQDFQDSLNVFENDDGSLTDLGKEVRALSQRHEKGLTTPDEMAQAEMEQQGVTPPGSQQNPIRIQNEADYNSVPPGAYYVSPDGKLRRKSG